MKFSLVATWFVVLVGLLAVASLVLAFWLRKRRWFIKLSTSLLAIILVVLAILGGINKYYSYRPTIGDLLGRHPNVINAKNLVKYITENPAEIPKSGKVFDKDIPSIDPHFKPRAATIYVPPQWFDPRNKDFAVVEMFHGTPGSPRDWTNGPGAAEEADKWAHQHGGQAPILIMPDINGSFLNDTECLNGKLGNVEEYLTQTVREFAIKELRASPDRRKWAVGGLSEGGYCAAMLTLRHPDMFRVFMDFGGNSAPTSNQGLSEFFDGDAKAQAREYDLRVLLQKPPTEKVSGWFVAGTGDKAIVKSNAELHSKALSVGIDSHNDTIKSGGHTFETWKACLAASFSYVAAMIEDPEATIHVPPTTTEAPTLPPVSPKIAPKRGSTYKTATTHSYR